MRGPNRAATDRARRLRRADNDAEAVLWSELRNRRLNGYKFVRQHPIGVYYADFACREANLVVEIDGSQHAESERDRKRDRFMVSQGWSVLRFWNVDVLTERDSVLETILAALERRLEPVVAPDLRFVAVGPYTDEMRDRDSAPHPLPDLLPVKNGEKEDGRDADDPLSPVLHGERVRVRGSAR